MFRLFVLFTTVPLLELMLLIEVGSRAGALTTIAICLVTGFVGASLAKSQGADVVRRITATVQQGVLPARELLDGVLILVAGVVLLTPGFVTDAMGILLLTPPIRALIRVGLFRWIQGRIVSGAWTVMREGRGQGEGQAQWSTGSDDWQPSTSGPEIIPPEHAPRPPKPGRPDVIDVT